MGYFAYNQHLKLNIGMQEYALTETLRILPIHLGFISKIRPFSVGAFEPYVRASVALWIGFSNQSLVRDASTQAGGAWASSLGLSYKITEKLSLGTEAQYNISRMGGIKTHHFGAAFNFGGRF